MLAEKAGLFQGQNGNTKFTLSGAELDFMKLYV